MLEQLRLMLNMENDSSKDELLTQLLQFASSRIIIATGSTALPANLQWIAIELAVKRYNKLGYEGLTSESIEGLVNRSFEADEAELAPYLIYFPQPSTTTSKFRFL